MVNQAGKIILTTGQFAQWPAFNETPAINVPSWATKSTFSASGTNLNHRTTQLTASSSHMHVPDNNTNLVSDACKLHAPAASSTIIGLMYFPWPSK